MAEVMKLMKEIIGRIEQRRYIWREHAQRMKETKWINEKNQ